MDTQTPLQTSDNSDPSSLTTQQLWREIAALKELIFTRIDGIVKLVGSQHEDLVRVPTDVEKSVSNLKELHEEKFKSMTKLFENRAVGVDNRLGDIANIQNEKFKSIETQFRERDTRTEQTAKDSKVAVDAALQAAKELVAQQNFSIAQSNTKQEVSFSKQIDQQGVMIAAAAASSNSIILDLKERLTRIEGAATGRRDFWGYIVGAVGLIAALIAIFYALNTN